MIPDEKKKNPDFQFDYLPEMSTLEEPRSGFSLSLYQFAESKNFIFHLVPPKER